MMSLHINNYKKILLAGLFILPVMIYVPNALAESKSLEQVLVNMVKLHPLVQIKNLEQQSAALDLNKAESKTGWYLKGNAGANHDLSFLGTPTDISTAGLGLEKTFAFGGRVSVDGSYKYEDADLTLNPQIPNPSASTNFDLKYTHPLGRGAGNPDYYAGIKNAEASKIIAQANWQENRDELSRQVIDLYFSLAKVNAQIDNTLLAIKRAKRLKQYTVTNINLGVSEKKDLLQAEARLQASIAEKGSLQVIRERQYIALNRLTALPWQLRFDLVTNESDKLNLQSNFDDSYEQVKENSWGLKRNNARIMVAETFISTSRDLNRDDFNITLSAGSRNRTGEVAGEDFNESDYAAGIQLQYRRALDRQGLESELTQAQLKKSIGYQEQSAITLDLGYQLSSLLSEMNELQSSLVRSKKSLRVEKSKNNEVLKRYRNGRADTSELIIFENDYRFAEFTVTNKQLELQRMLARLDLLKGELWKRINHTQGTAP